MLLLLARMVDGLIFSPRVRCGHDQGVDSVGRGRSSATGAMVVSSGFFSQESNSLHHNYSASCRMFTLGPRNGTAAEGEPTALRALANPISRHLGHVQEG